MILCTQNNESKLPTNQSYLQLGKFFPPDWGGIETVTFNLLMGLTEKGIKNAVLVFGDQDSVETQSCAGNSGNVYRVKHSLLLNKPICLQYLLKFKQLSAEYDVVIVHLPNPVATVALMFSGYKGRVVLYWHSDIVNKGLLGRLLTPLDYWLISRANIVIAPTKAHLEFSRYASEFGSKGRVSPYPIDPRQVMVAENRSKMPRTLLGKKEIRLLAIGRLVEYKGIEYLICAIPNLPSSYSIHLDIVGDGPLREHLDSLISEFGLQQKVFLHGHVTEEERERYLCEADIFCFPSVTKAEMYGMVQIEAMAHGLPIISTDIPGSGSPELTRMTGAGLVVLPCSSLEIGKAIQRLIEDPSLYAKLSEAGINAIINTFNPSVLTDEFCRLCQKA